MLACHDLRTPLATVHGFAHTLARKEDLDETTMRYVEMINTASGQLAELIDDLSVSARLAGDRYDPILILGRVLNLSWPTVRALILLWYGPQRAPADADIETARANFTKLMPSTAERVVNFWRTRQTI